MPHTKPPQWNINQAEVDPRFHWVFAGLDIWAPCYSWNMREHAPFGLLEENTNYTDSTYTTESTAVGLAIKSARTGTGFDAGWRTPDNFYCDVTIDPWTVYCLFMIPAKPGSDERELFSWDGQITVRYDDVSSGLQVVGNAMLGSMTASGDTVVEVGKWYHVFLRSPGGDRNGPVYGDAFAFTTGEHVYDESQTFDGLETDQSFEWDRGGGTGDIYFGQLAVWKRYLNDDEMQLLVAEPFGPTTRRPPLSPAVSTLTLYATADGTINEVVNELDTTTNLYASVDDDPGSPTDADWINNTDSSASVFFDLTNMPGDFATMDTLKVTVRWRGQNFIQSNTLYAQVFQSDESTSLSDEMTVETASADTSFANTSEITFTGLNTSANKATWDGARIRLRWA